MASLVFIALTINGFFFKNGDPQPQRFSQPITANPAPSRSVSIPQPQQQRINNETDEPTRKAKQEAIEEILRKEAAQKAAQEAEAKRIREEAAAAHKRFLERYLNADSVRTPGNKSVAIVVASEDGKLNQVVSTALAQHFKTDSVEFFSSFFTPEFVSDKLFAKVFSGSTDVLKKLEVANSLDVLLLSRQTVQYSTSPNLMNLVTANMQLEVQVLPIAKNVQGGTWTFTSNGSGFKNVEARSMAEERLIIQISKDTKMSIN